ncbi:Hypothetical predicted protein [Mytilus galloprovincialis]|uniref:Reverse transcriptase domain-containing protein n=1 Tax=Mytilus galloprovincialis TaxID=29158 RepID=A0A8B6G2U0_MYTGA|nr:Hypothetical predicted protein [Mytilus galloprovincialis]
MPHPLQFGFVKEHGAIPAIYTLKEAIHYYLERNSIVYAIFLDNEKAFDRVWQDGLLYKLNQIGIQDKLLLRKIVKHTIDIYEENKWKHSVERRPEELKRYYKIHTCLTEHRLLRLAVTYPSLNSKFMTLVKLGAIAIQTGKSSLCNLYNTDILMHYILCCKSLLQIRTEMFYKIVDILDVEDSVRFFNQDDDEIVESLLATAK